MFIRVHVCSLNNTWSIFRLETKAETIVGDDIIYLHSSSDYNVHFPIHRGEINVTSGVGKLFFSIVKLQIIQLLGIFKGLKWKFIVKFLS